jgi:DNA-binding response OmpR family regulator
MTSVLIVEDDLSIADLLQTGLEAEGYRVCGIARTINEAKESAQQDAPDFAIIDVHLANGDLGTEVAANLRCTTNAGIMFSTGNNGDIALMKTLGEAVMTKPYRMRDAARGLKIIGEIAQSGQTDLAFPRNFRLLDQVVK